MLQVLLLITHIMIVFQLLPPIPHNLYFLSYIQKNVHFPKLYRLDHWFDDLLWSVKIRTIHHLESTWHSTFPTAQKSVNIGWKRKFQWAEILTRSPVKKLQRGKSEKKGKQKMWNLATNLARSFSADNSAKKTQSTYKSRYFCQVCEDPSTEPHKEDWIQWS